MVLPIHTMVCEELRDVEIQAISLASETVNEQLQFGGSGAHLLIQIWSYAV